MAPANNVLIGQQIARWRRGLIEVVIETALVCESS